MTDKVTITVTIPLDGPLWAFKEDVPDADGFIEWAVDEYGPDLLGMVADLGDYTASARVEWNGTTADVRPL